MPTFTTRLSLIKPAIAGEIVDVAQFNANMDKVDQFGAGPFVCTSLTRPSAPYVGLLIYETDTDYIRMWTGDTTLGNVGWVWTGGKALSVGYRIAPTANQTFPNSSNERVDYFNDGTIRREFFPGYTADISAVSVPTANQRGFKINETGLWEFETGMWMSGGVVAQTWAAAGTVDTYSTFDYRAQGANGNEAFSRLKLRINDLNQYINHVVFQASGGTASMLKTNSTPYVKFTYLGA